MKDLLVKNPARSQHSTASEVWLRISAFLSLKSDTTRVYYLGIIKEWCEFLKVEMGSSEAAKKMLGVSYLHAIAYRQWLNSRPGEAPRNSPKSKVKTEKPQIRIKAFSAKKTGLESTQSNATIAKKFAVLRRIYKVLLNADLGIKSNPFDSDQAPPPPKDAGRKRPTELLAFEKVKGLIEMADAESARGLRDKAILSLLFGGALRRSEVANLRVGDVRKTPSGTVFVYLRSTKARKDAQQALPKWAAKSVAQLVLHRKKHKASEHDYLCVGFTGQAGKLETHNKISESSIYALFKSYCARAGLGTAITPHSARATAITKLLADGIPHRQVQEFSRHSSIQMVELYDKRRIGVDENVAKDLDYD